MKTSSMQFDGSLLARGFWLYVWRITARKGRVVLYVGRTGDSASRYASSPFKRIGQHLDTARHAKGNALGRRLREEGIDPTGSDFEMLALGPLFPEQPTFAKHRPFRDKTAALERALAEHLAGRDYEVLGIHDCFHEPDARLFARVCRIVDPQFPDRKRKARRGKRVPARR